MTLVTGFSFVEAFILPQLVTVSPPFVAGILGMFSGAPQRDRPRRPPNIMEFIRTHVYLRTPAVWHRYVPRRVLPRWAGGLLVLGACWSPSVQWFPLSTSPRS